MKKYNNILLFCVLSLILALALCACSGDAEPVPTQELTVQDTPEPTESQTTPEPTAQITPEPDVVGMIDSEVMYKDIEVSRIYGGEEFLINILGEPLSTQGPYYYYDGLTLYVRSGYVSDNETFEYVDAFGGTNLSLFTIDGVTLDKTHAELIAVFGEPAIDDILGGSQMMSYYTTNGYILGFSFNTLEDKASQMSIWKK